MTPAGPSRPTSDRQLAALARRVWRELDDVLRSHAFIALLERPRGQDAPALARRLDDLLARARLILPEPSPFGRGAPFATLLDLHLASVLDRPVRTDAVQSLRAAAGLAAADTSSPHAFNDFILRSVGERLAEADRWLQDADDGRSDQDAIGASAGERGERDVDLR